LSAPQHSVAWILTRRAESPEAGPRVWGLSSHERLRRSLSRAGVSRIEVLTPADAPPSCSERCVLLRDDFFYDDRLLQGLLGAGECVLEVPRPAQRDRGPDEPGEIAIAANVGGDRVGAAIARLFGHEPDEAGDGPPLPSVAIADLAPAYDPTLRRHAPAFAYHASSENRREIENRIYAASYKGVTDLVTKWVFPLPARGVVRALTHLGVRPNTVTTVSYGLAALVAWLFAEGWFALGLVLGWLMTFLDTVDGKLARCTLTSTRFGGALDHGLDLVHPPLWWAAWAYGMPGGFEANELALWIVVGGYVVGRLLEGAFLAAFRMELFVWRPFDAHFRTVIARRNPNLILLGLGLALGSPTGGFEAVAVWTAICVLVAAVRNVQAHTRRRRGTEIVPWLDSAASAGARSTSPSEIPPR
jgi:phosphatidylglycerophosphate synthase